MSLQSLQNSYSLLLQEQEISSKQEGTQPSEKLLSSIISDENKMKLPKETILSCLTHVSRDSGQQITYENLEEETFALPELYYEKKEPIIPRIRRTSYKPDDFKLMQKWEGYVIQRKKDSFVAGLIDLTENNPEEEAEFPLEEIYKEDLKLVTPGAIFYWSIGYLDSNSGRTRASIIRFRRLPAWTESEIKEAKHKAEKIYKAFNPTSSINKIDVKQCTPECS